MPRALEPLRSREFRIFIFGTVFFTGAMQMQMVAQGWLVFRITGSNLALGTVTFMWSIAAALCSPLAGILADRFPKRRLLMVTWGGSGVVFAVVAALILTDNLTLWHLAAAALVNGMLFAFNIPARFALVSQIVGDHHLMGAMALVSVVFNISGFIFPLMVGGIIDLAGAGGAYFLIASLYMCAAATVSFLSKTERVSTHQGTSILTDLIAGARFAAKDKAVRWLFVLIFAAVIFGQSWANLLPGFAASLGLPASGLGLLFALSGLGAIVGNIWVANLRPTARLGRWMFLLGAASGVSLIALALTRSLYPALIVLFFMGLTGFPFFTINQTLVQLLTPLSLRGRMQSVNTLAWASMPLGTIPLSALADRSGVWVSFLVAGTGTAVVMILVAFLQRSLFNLTRAAPPESATIAR